MKKAFLILICLVISLNISGQENKLKINSTSFGFGIIGSSSEYSGGGSNIELDLSTNLNKNLLSLFFNGGSEFQLFDAEEKYIELSLTYGREIKLIRWIGLEGHVGIGYFNYTLKNGSTDFNTVNKSTIGFPLRVKLIFYTGKNFGIGINPNMNLNSIVNTYSGNLIFQFKF